MSTDDHHGNVCENCQAGHEYLNAHHQIPEIRRAREDMIRCDKIYFINPSWVNERLTFGDWGVGFSDGFGTVL